MADADRLLELIEEGIVAHGGDLGGWTLKSDEALQLFDGRVTLRAKVDAAPAAASEAMVHAHVLTTLHEYEDEVLDACLFAAGETVDAALKQATAIWIMSVAGPIRSFLDDKPICMTCQAGVAGGDASQGFSPGDYGLPRLRAFVGPGISRGLADDTILSAIDDTKPWFRFAAESAMPRRVHLAKATIAAKGKEGWSRELEIDGHDIAHHDPDWPAGVPAPEFAYLTRFAVFEFPRNSAAIEARAELERTIRYFAEHFSEYESTDRLMETMVGQGFDPDLVHDVESISTIAFGRVFFEQHGIQYPSTIIRARRDGRVEPDVPLMSLPAYNRARALAVSLPETLSEEDFQSLCLYNAESHLIVQALESGGGKVDFSRVRLFPCVVPERGVSDQTMGAAMAMLHAMADQCRPSLKKPWWKFW